MSQRGIGRTEIIIGVGVVGLLLLVALPFVFGKSSDAARAEVPLNVDAIRTAEVTYREAFEEYVSAEAAPRAPEAVNAEPVAWEPSKGFVKLAWEPEETTSVYGAYSVSATRDAFTVEGTSDIDGDGRRAVYRATADEPASRLTGEDVY